MTLGEQITYTLKKASMHGRAAAFLAKAGSDVAVNHARSAATWYRRYAILAKKASR